MVLVDTSVWVNHLRTGSARLRQLLEEGQVLCHPFVIGELACGNLANRHEVVTLLQNLPSLPEIAHAEALWFIERHDLTGRGIGLIDVHLLAAARLAGAELWTDDRRLARVASRLKR